MEKDIYHLEIDKLLKVKYKINLSAFKVIIVYLALFFIHSFAETHINIHKKNFDDLLLQKKSFTFLIVGTDKKIGVNRTDTILLVFLNTVKKRIDIISIPRDTRSKVKGKGYRKINSAYAYFSRKSPKKGIDELINSIHSFLDVKIDYFVLVDLLSFVKIIDAMGGIPLNISQDMHYIDHAGGLKIDLKKGPNILTGSTAIQYVRYREKLFGDIGRVKRQQKFINAIVKKLKDYKTWLNIHKMVQVAYSNIYTNLSISTVLGLSKELLKLKYYKKSLNILPGTPAYINHVSYYVVDYDKLDALVNKITSKTSKEKKL